MITGGTVVARIIALWLLVLGLSFTLLFSIGVFVGGSESELANLEGILFLLVLQNSLILSIAIYFATVYWKNRKR